MAGDVMGITAIRKLEEMYRGYIEDERSRSSTGPGNIQCGGLRRAITARQRVLVAEDVCMNGRSVARGQSIHRYRIKLADAAAVKSGAMGRS